jgi:hypothetical protein
MLIGISRFVMFRKAMILFWKSIRLLIRILKLRLLLKDVSGRDMLRLVSKD